MAPRTRHQLRSATRTGVRSSQPEGAKPDGPFMSCVKNADSEACAAVGLTDRHTSSDASRPQGHAFTPWGEPTLFVGTTVPTRAGAARSSRGITRGRDSPAQRSINEFGHLRMAGLALSPAQQANINLMARRACSVRLRISMKASNLTRPPQTDPIQLACGPLHHPGWLPSEQVAGFNRNRRLRRRHAEPGPTARSALGARSVNPTGPVRCALSSLPRPGTVSARLSLRRQIRRAKRASLNRSSRICVLDMFRFLGH
jgi:hypothetical protein